MQRTKVGPSATAGMKVVDVSEIDPVVDIQCKDAEPGAIVVRLRPNAFVAQFAIVAMNRVYVTCHTIAFDRLNKPKVLTLQIFEEDPVSVDTARRERGLDGESRINSQRLCVQCSVERSEPTSNGAFYVETLKDS